MAFVQWWVLNFFPDAILIVDFMRLPSGLSKLGCIEYLCSLIWGSAARIVGILHGFSPEGLRVSGDFLLTSISPFGGSFTENNARDLPFALIDTRKSNFLPMWDVISKGIGYASW